MITTATGATTALTPAQRGAAALERAQAALPDATNAKLLQAAILEAAAAALADDPSFAARVRGRYAELAAPPARAKGQGGKAGRAARVTPKVSDLLEPLVPVKRIPNYEVTIEGPLDPYVLLDVFGPHQLERALSQRSLADVRKAAAIVQGRQPGVQPEGRAGKAKLIAFIVECLIGRAPGQGAARPAF